MALQKFLIVEAFEDENFFKKLLSNLQIANVMVTSNPAGKGNAIRTFGDALELKPITSHDRIGLIVDADHVQHGAGYRQTISEINQMVLALQFNPLTALLGGGQVVSSNRHSNLRAGVWVMPNNVDDGAMEDFLLTSVANSELSRFQYAKTECGKALASSLGFPTQAHHLSKAEYGTWTAWQNPPRSSFARAFERQLFNTSSAQFVALSNWLKWLFV